MWRISCTVEIFDVAAVASGGNGREVAVCVTLTALNGTVSASEREAGGGGVIEVCSGPGDGRVTEGTIEREAG